MLYHSITFTIGILCFLFFTLCYTLSMSISSDKCPLQSFVPLFRISSDSPSMGLTSLVTLLFFLEGGGAHVASQPRFFLPAEITWETHKNLGDGCGRSYMCVWFTLPPTSPFLFRPVSRTHLIQPATKDSTREKRVFSSFHYVSESSVPPAMSGDT